MRKNILVFFICLLSGIVPAGRAVSAEPSAVISSSSTVTTPLQDKEKLLFLIRWGAIHGGYATLEIDGRETYQGQECFSIVSHVRSNDFFDTFYTVRDLNRTWMTVDGLYSLGFEKNQREGKYVRNQLVDFDYAGKKIRIHKKDKVEEFPLENERLHDVLSALYFMRTLDVGVNKEYPIVVCTGDKIWTMKVKVLSEETVKVPSGKFSCYKVKPELVGEGIFESKGDLYVWLTKDARLMPVLMKAKILIGSITAELVSQDPAELERVFAAKSEKK
jgi:hypothetical protein